MITSKADCSCLISVLYNGEKAKLKINSYKVLWDPSQCTLLKNHRRTNGKTIYYLRHIRNQGFVSRCKFMNPLFIFYPIKNRLSVSYSANFLYSAAQSQKSYVKSDKKILARSSSLVSRARRIQDFWIWIQFVKRFSDLYLVPDPTSSVSQTKPTCSIEH